MAMHAFEALGKYTIQLLHPAPKVGDAGLDHQVIMIILQAPSMKGPA